MQLFLLLLLALAIVATARTLRRQIRRAPAASHHRVLTTLDTLTRRPVDHPVRDRTDDSRQHVRLVPAAEVHRGRWTPGTQGLASDLASAPVAAAAPPRDVARQAPAGTDVEDGSEQARHPVARAASSPTAGAQSGHRPGHARSPVPAGGRPRPSAPAVALAGAAHLRVRSHRRRPLRPVMLTLIGAAAVVVIAAAVVLDLPGSADTGRHQRTATSAKLPVTRAPAPAPTPSTTVPPRPTVTLVSSSPAASVFSLSGPARITFRASGASWAQLRTGGPDGAVLYEGILEPGQTESVAGPSWIRLGNPTAVAIDVNGTAISAPAVASGVPTDLQFG
jgi:hypothetical protein